MHIAATIIKCRGREYCADLQGLETKRANLIAFGMFGLKDDLQVGR